MPEADGVIITGGGKDGAIRRAKGERADTAGMFAERFERCASVRVPDSGGVILAASGEEEAIGTESQRPDDPTGVAAFEGEFEIPGSGVPKPDFAADGASCQDG